jgi:type I restriction enzyme R subunit
MSELLDALIKQRRQAALNYEEYLSKIVELTKRAKNPSTGSYPDALNTPARRALYDNLGKNEELALAVDNAVRETSQDDWRGNPFKLKRVKYAIEKALENTDAATDQVLDLVKNQNEY